MSNMVFARPSTGTTVGCFKYLQYLQWSSRLKCHAGIIEIVGSPDAQRHADPKGVWPGYQSGLMESASLSEL